MKVKELEFIDGEALMETRFAPTKYCIDQLLPQGVAMISGEPKIGKSWLVLEWCIRIAKGDPVWNFKTTRSTVLYLCLEDRYKRIQDRCCKLDIDVPQELKFSFSSCALDEGLQEQIESFVAKFPDTGLVVIDTFQKIRNCEKDMSYANDYKEVERIKEIADKLNITILLVHHNRKQGDKDPLNRILGTTGIGGALDTAFIMEKQDRRLSRAKLTCTGRDIEYRELELDISDDNKTSKVISDSVDAPETLLPDTVIKLVEYMRETCLYIGSNTEFAEDFSSFCGKKIIANSLKRTMNRYWYELEQLGVVFESSRSNGNRILNIRYVFESDDSDDKNDKDDKNDGVRNIVNIVPIDPERAG